MNENSLSPILALSTKTHHHLCPRQVLGARMGLWAGELLGIDLPGHDRCLLAIVETDGCLVDGISAATACTPGRRTLRIEDYGKAAATFVDLEIGTALRIAPSLDARWIAADWAPEASSPWQAQLLGYQRMPAEVLLSRQEVQLRVPLSRITSRPGVKAFCAVCGEEIMNGREVQRDGNTLCRSCAGESYYASLPAPMASLPENQPVLMKKLAEFRS